MRPQKRTFCPPPGKIPKLREPGRIPVAWTLGQVNRIFKAVDQLQGDWDGVPIGLAWRIGLLVFWDTGSRLGAVLGARLRHIDLVARTLLVPAENI